MKGLEFNTITPNLLATGAEDGEIKVWDVAKPNNPKPPTTMKVRSHMRGTGSGSGSGSGSGPGFRV